MKQNVRLTCKKNAQMLIHIFVQMLKKLLGGRIFTKHLFFKRVSTPFSSVKEKLVFTQLSKSSYITGLYSESLSLDDPCPWGE